MKEGGVDIRGRGGYEEGGLDMRREEWILGGRGRLCEGGRDGYEELGVNMRREGWI